VPQQPANTRFPTHTHCCRLETRTHYMAMYSNLNAHFDDADWTFVSSSPSSAYQSSDDSSSDSSTPRPLQPRLPRTNTNTNTKRPRFQRRPSPEAMRLLSLVHPHEPIKVPVPPSLQAKGRRLSERAISQRQQQQAWYDYNEFGILVDGRSPPAKSAGSWHSASGPHAAASNYSNAHGSQLTAYNPPNASSLTPKI
jgi:hypothetical protein